jgi:AcrR family transcriptional regulator
MTAEFADALPGAVAAAWGMRGRPGKGTKSGLTLDRVVQAGIKVAVADGLGAVSMARVAAEVGSSAMALYRYVASKDELLDLMVDAAIGTPPALEGSDWRAGLETWAWAERETFRRNPWALRVPISGPPATPNNLAWMEAGLGCLRETRLTPSEKISVILLLSGYVRNEALLNSDMTAAQTASGSTDDDMMSAYSAMLKQLLRPPHFPELRAVIAAGVLDKADGPTAEFVFGLQRILDGIGLLITRG